RAPPTAHGPPYSRHVVPAARKPSTRALPPPPPRRSAEPSHAPLCEAPVQWVDDDANPSTGHAPDVPGQVSATSHWPAESRHVEPAARKTSTHALPLPVQ